MDSILEVNGLVKKYPAFFLDNISFSLPEGCVLGFIGANGAGKTTTIRSIYVAIGTSSCVPSGK